MRWRLLSLTVLVLLPLVLVAGPRAEAGDRHSKELELLRRSYRTIGELAMQYSELAEYYQATGQPKRAAEARVSMTHLVAQQAQVAKRIEEVLSTGQAIPRSMRPAIGVGGKTGGAFRPRRIIRPEGATRQTRTAVDLGLEWLKRNQDPMGFWDCDGVESPGHKLYDPGVTGLALLAYLGAGETHREGRYKTTVKRGLTYLKSIQDPEGCFGPRTTQHFIYNHGCASLAMIEAYAQTGSPLFKQSAQAAIDFIIKSQNPYLGWRYGVRPGDSDTSVTGWMVMALIHGQRAGLRVPASGLDGAKAWIEKVTEPEYGRVGYTTRGTGSARPQHLMDKFPTDRTEALTAAGLAMRILMGEDPKKSEMIRKGIDLCLKVPPRWDESAGTIDMYYWFYGSIAFFQIGGEPWKVWNKAMKSAILDHQEKEGEEKGSWAPVGVWGHEGGRVYSTALMTLCLQSYDRLPRLRGTRLVRKTAGASVPLKAVAPKKVNPPDLSRRLTFSLTDAPVAEALDMIARVTGSTIHIGPRARSTVMTAKLTLSVTDVDLKTILDLVTAHGDLAWSVNKGVIHIDKK